MGILNVIKLANDYNNAKKLLKSKKFDATKIKDAIDKLHDFIEELKNMKNELDAFIVRTKELMRKLSELLKTRKVGK